MSSDTVAAAGTVSSGTAAAAGTASSGTVSAAGWSGTACAGTGWPVSGTVAAIMLKEFTVWAHDSANLGNMHKMVKPKSVQKHEQWDLDQLPSVCPKSLMANRAESLEETVD